jgi:hypothetical protein
VLQKNPKPKIVEELSSIYVHYIWTTIKKCLLWMLYDQLKIRSDHMMSKYNLLVSFFIFFEKVSIACITKGCGIFH